MAQIFQLNGTTLTHINDCQWLENEQGDYLNGKMPKNRWRNVRLSGEAMEEAQYDIIHALEGQKVSVTITDYESRNSDFKTYYGADLLSISGDHNGPKFDNVSVELKVRI